MANSRIIIPSGYFPDPEIGRPIFNGKIYVGVIDLNPRIASNQLDVTGIQESGAEVSIAQPIRTSQGGVPVDDDGNIVTLLVDGAYSMAIDDRNDNQKYYFANVSSGAPVTFDDTPVFYRSTLTIAIADEDLTLGQSVITGGYTTENDGGGAQYVVVAGGTGTDDGLSYIDKTDGSGLQLEFIYNGSINVAQAGAAGDGVTDDSAAIQAAIDFVYSKNGGDIFFDTGIYICGTTIVPKRWVICRGSLGTVVIKMADNANITLVESFMFDTLYSEGAYQISDNPDMTYDYGFAGIIFDGNKDNQSSTDYLVKMYGRNLVLDQCTLSNTLGVGLWTALTGTNSGNYDYTQTKSQGIIDGIEILDCVQEGWIYEGPSDQYIGHVVTNEIGDQTNDGTVPQTSVHFPGEKVHGVRAVSAMYCQHMNLNGTRFGSCLYVEEKFFADRIICAGGWGPIEFTSTAYGTVNEMNIAGNEWDWDGTTYPFITNSSNDMQFNATFCRRGGSDLTTVPFIRDSGGAQWGLIKNRQSLDALGTLFEADTDSVNICSLIARACDVALETTTNCNRINITAEFNNVNSVWINNSTAIRGSWDFTGTLNSGQTFGTGIDSAPDADKESLSNARIEFLDNGVWKSNSFRGVEEFDSTSIIEQNIIFTHGLWRAPEVEDIVLTARISGSPTDVGGMELVISAFDATTITTKIKITTAATGTPFGQVVCRV